MKSFIDLTGLLTDGNIYLHQLTAKAIIQHQITNKEIDDKIKTDIIALALKYNILCPFTNFFALEKQENSYSKILVDIPSIPSPPCISVVSTLNSKSKLH